MVQPSIVRHVTALKSVKVPPIGEDIVDVYVDRHDNQEKEEENSLLVEMHSNLPEGYGCVLDPLMVDATIGTNRASGGGEHHLEMKEP